MPLSQSAEFGASIDTGGIMIKADPSAIVDNIFTFQDPGGQKWIRIIEAEYRASWAGAFGAGDKTAALQTVINSASVSTLVIDTVFTISGTLSIPAGKTLRFQKNGKIQGSGTISGGIIEAGYRQQIFETTLTVNPAGVGGEYFSVMWFGAKGDGATNDAPAIQTTIDTVVRAKATVNTVYFPNANFLISAPLIVYYWTGSIYQGFTIKLKGESTSWQGSGQGTRITTNFQDRFALGIQGGKGCQIDGIYFIGSANWNSAVGYGYQWYKMTRSEYIAQDVTARNSTFSPYAGVVIDPFRNGSLPPDGGYPGNDAFGVALSTYYRGSGTGGSSAIKITECAFEKFVVGICCSPNGQTGNADLTLIDHARFQQIAVGVSTGQAQEKSCVLRNVGAWSNIHTFFLGGTTTYGTATPGQWNIHNVQFAGPVNTFISFNTQGYFACNISYIFSESMGRFGSLGGTVNGSSVSDCEIGFAYQENSAIPEWHFDFQNVLLKNSKIRYYGQNLPVTFKQATSSNNIIQNCGFEVLPYIGPYLNGSTPPGYTFEGCTIQTGGEISMMGKPSATFGGSASGSMYAYGQRTVVDYANTPTYKRGFRYEEEFPYRMMTTTAMTGVAITISDPNGVSGTVDSRRNFSFSIPTNQTFLVSAGMMLYYITGALDHAPAGVIKAVNAGTGQVDVKWAGYNMVDGSYGFYVMAPILDIGGFMGDVSTASSGTLITNCRQDFGLPGGNFSGLVGKWIRNANFRTTGGYINMFKVITATLQGDGVQYTLTVSNTTNTGSTYNAVGEYFTNAKEKFIEYPNASQTLNTTNQILQKGMTMKLNTAGQIFEYKVTRTGWYNASTAPSLADSRWATWVPVVPTYVSGSPEGVSVFPQGVIVTNSLNGEQWVKSVTDVTINGGSANWKRLGNIPEITDTFTLAATGTRPVAIGETLTDLYLNPTVGMTIDIGTTLAGIDIQDQIVLPAGVTTIVSFKKKADSAFTVYFTGVTGGTLNITLVKKIV